VREYREEKITYHIEHDHVTRSEQCTTDDASPLSSITTINIAHDITTDVRFAARCENVGSAVFRACVVRNVVCEVGNAG